MTSYTDAANAEIKRLRAEVERLTAKNAALAQELRETDEALGDYTVNLIRSLPEAAAKLRAEVERLRASCIEARWLLERAEQLAAKDAPQLADDIRGWRIPAPTDASR